MAVVGKVLSEIWTSSTHICPQTQFPKQSQRSMVRALDATGVAVAMSGVSAIQNAPEGIGNLCCNHSLGVARSDDCDRLRKL